ncbi:MAG: helix-turn-helix domain-containing protein [Chloroflexota bacterium]
MATTGEKLTLQQAASELGRSQTQVRRYIRAGKLPAEKVGSQWLVDRADLDDFRRGVLRFTGLAMKRPSSREWLSYVNAYASGSAGIWT